MAIQYVGGRGAGRAGSTSAVNVAINSGLSGGIGSAAIAGDLVVVTVATATQGRNPECGVSGYTQLTQQHTTATTYDISVRTSYKFMGATPDTTVTIPATGNIADGQGYTIHVYRGVDPTVPLDGVTPTYLTGSGANNNPDPASIQPATAGAWIYFGGGGAAGNGTTVFTAAYLAGFLSYNGPDTNDGTVGAGHYTGWSSGAYNGAAFGGGSTNAANSWGCTALVLRPEPLSAHGFLTATPTYRSGTEFANPGANIASAVKFTCPGSGTQEITEIGLWVKADLSTTCAFRLAIFTHDVANDNPDTIVANSESAELSHGTTTITKKSHTYGTKPQLTGGTVYWLVYYAADANAGINKTSDVAANVWTVAATYPTWPTAAQWDSGTDGTEDASLYAVYQEAAASSTADLFVTLAGCVVAAAATLVATAALAIQLAGATVGSGATVPTVADLGKTLAGVTLSADATVDSGLDERLADLGVTLGGNSVSSASTAPVVAAASVQVGAASVAATGVVPVTADLAVGMGDASLAASATAPVVADAGINLAGGVLASGATAPVDADAAVQLAGATVSATASTTDSRNADLSVTLEGASISAAATSPVEVDAMIQLAGVSLSSIVSTHPVQRPSTLRLIYGKTKTRFNF
jgi:hypothetical protein